MSEDAPVACWLCQNHELDDVRDFHMFLSRNAHQVDAMSAAVQFREHLVSVRGLRAAVDLGGQSLAAVRDTLMDEDEDDFDEGAAASADVEEEASPVDELDLPSVEEILRHVLRHNLDPSVKVAHILRSLSDLAETLREVVVTRGEDGMPLIDVRTVTVYLKVISETIQVYKSADPSKMLFASSE